MPVAILMCGIPGSGKSRVRDLILSRLPSGSFTDISPDDTIGDMGIRMNLTWRQVYDNKHLKSFCYERCWEELAAVVKEGGHVLIDRTHNDAAHRVKTLDFLQQHAPGRYTAYCVHVAPPEASLWVQRLDGREDKPIPVDALFSFARAHERPHLDEGFENIWSSNSDFITTVAGAYQFDNFLHGIRSVMSREAATLLN